jgi:hypothetical protein
MLFPFGRVVDGGATDDVYFGQLSNSAEFGRYICSFQTLQRRFSRRLSLLAGALQRHRKSKTHQRRPCRIAELPAR